MSLCLIPLYLLLIIPGVIYTVFWAFALQFVILKNKSGFEAMKASKALAKGHYWQIINYIVSFGVLFGICIMTIPMLLYGMTFPLTEGVLATIRDGSINGFLNSLSCVFTIFTTLFFLELLKEKGEV